MSNEQRLALALLLAVSARALVFVFVVAVAIRVLPVAALDPAWQMTVCSVLLHQAALPLLALVLMHAASAMDPADGRLASARRRWRGLAVAAALGFLLLLPLQAIATWRGIMLVNRQDAVRRLDAERRSAAMLQAIAAATSLDDLQARMQVLQGPTLTPADRALPLPQLRRQLEANLLAARRQLIDRYSGPSPAQLWTLISDGVRLALSSLAYALAFAAGAQRRHSPMPQFKEWSVAFGRWRHVRPWKRAVTQKRSSRGEAIRYFGEIEPRDS